MIAAEPIRRFQRTDWFVFAGLVTASLGLRLFVRSRTPFHWDSAQFAIAIHQYNLTLSQPHAPGYFLYVMAGRLLNLLLGDPNASLVWISVVSGSVLVGLLYLLGTALFNPRVGWAAGLLTLSSPLVWFNSCVALTYVPDACLSALFILISWKAIEQGGGWGYAVTLGVLGAVIAGVRPQTAPTLVPAGLWAFWNFKRHRFVQLLVAGIVSLALVLAWFVPMLRSSGGWEVYRQLVRLNKETYGYMTVLGGGGWDAFCLNIMRAAIFCWTGLFLGVLAIAAGLVYRVTAMDRDRRRQWNQRYARAFLLWTAWVVPMLVFGTILALTKQPGYVLNYLPALILLVAVALDHLRGRGPVAVATAILVATNTCVFAGWPVNWQSRLASFWYTAAEIRAHDTQLESMVSLIRSRYNPARTVLYHAREFLLFGLRHFQYELPEFDQYQLEIDHVVLSPPGRPMWRARGGRLDFVSGMSEGKGARSVLLIVPPGQAVGIFSTWLPVENAREVAGSHGTIFELAAD